MDTRRKLIVGEIRGRLQAVWLAIEMCDEGAGGNTAGSE